MPSVHDRYTRVGTPNHRDRCRQCSKYSHWGKIVVIGARPAVFPGDRGRQRPPAQVHCFAAFFLPDSTILRTSATLEDRIAVGNSTSSCSRSSHSGQAARCSSTRCISLAESPRGRSARSLRLTDGPWLSNDSRMTATTRIAGRPSPSPRIVKSMALSPSWKHNDHILGRHLKD